MSSAAALSAVMLAGSDMSDEQFFGATALLSTRCEGSGDRGDLRSDDEAPQLLFDWFRHALLRVPDLRVWDLNCQIQEYFTPASGHYLPQHWPWDTRDRVLALCDQLQSLPDWVPVFERELMAPSEASIRALVHGGAQLLGVDPYPMLWRYLSEHVDRGENWRLIAGAVDRDRLPEYLELARLTLGDASSPVLPSPGRPREQLWDVWRQVLALLRVFPGEGVDLVERALRSHDSGLRILAVEVLAIHWQGRHIPVDTWNFIRELGDRETDQTARRGFELLLQLV